MHTTISNRNTLRFEDKIPSSGSESAGLTLPGLPILGLAVPVLNGTPALTFEVSVDDGTTWLPLWNKDGATASITITGGVAAFVVSGDDLTPLAPYTGQLRDPATDTQIKVRIKSSVAQTAERVFVWIIMA